ncbi:MAG: hypothetical protein H0T79_08730 [Deltaproteobacteria bacterium]|nr:hypothetical protein [Deltaproteobacteria bacterium]
MSQNPPPQELKRSKPVRLRRPTWRSFALIASATIAISCYLFITAPPPLAAQAARIGKVPIRSVFSILETENDAARAMWTEEIVNRGKAVGLTFTETWQDERVHAGPLPALFLRETARHLERSPVRLRLFLGSRFPINAANSFTGQQADRFTQLERTGAPQFFFEPTTKLHTAMFTDRAVVEACVRCHNEHADSPKTDWQLHAIMGATTWMYPDETVTTERAVEMVAALRASIRAAYATYLQEVATFTERPEIGARWPKDGFYLPNEDAFMAELARRTSAGTVLGLIDPGAAELAAATEVVAEPEVAAKPAIKKPGYPTLVIRSAKATSVTIDHGKNRLLVARLPAGGSTSLSSRPPLRLKLGEVEGVQLEYDGKPVALPANDASQRIDEFEITLGELQEPEKS